VILMQVLPFADKKCLEAFAGFESGVYAGSMRARRRRRRALPFPGEAKRTPPEIAPTTCLI